MIRKITLSPLGLAAILAAGPAFAQGNDPLQCGIYRMTDWIGDSAEASDVAKAESAIQRVVDLATGQKAVLGFRVSDADTEVRVELRPENGNDPKVQIISASGETLAMNDDYGSTLASRVDLSLPAGDYCALVEEVSNNAIRMTAQVSRAEHPALISESASSSDTGIAACTAETTGTPLGDGDFAAAIGNGRVLSRVSAAETSYLRFDLTDLTPLILRAEASGPDPKVALFDAAGNLIAENDDADGLNSRLDFPAGLAAGSYCLGVTSVSQTTGQISVSAEKLDRESYLRSAFLRGEIPPSAGLDLPVEALDLDARLPVMALMGTDAIWYRFRVEEQTVLIFNAFGRSAGLDTKLRLFSGTGQMLEEVDDVEGSTDARIGPRLFEPGVYTMALTKVGASEGSLGVALPVMLSVERFVRAK